MAADKDKISEVRSSLSKAVERLSSLQDASNTQGKCLNVFTKGNTCTYTNYYHNIIPSFPFKIFVHLMTLIEVLTFINSKVKNTTIRLSKQLFLGNGLN